MLIQTAHFYPGGVLGRLYLYSILIFHNLVFQDLAGKIVQEECIFEIVSGGDVPAFSKKLPFFFYLPYAIDQFILGNEALDN
jgi:hypothetical protein